MLASDRRPVPRELMGLLTQRGVAIEIEHRPLAAMAELGRIETEFRQRRSRDTRAFERPEVAAAAEGAARQREPVILLIVEPDDFGGAPALVAATRRYFPHVKVSTYVHARQPRLVTMDSPGAARGGFAPAAAPGDGAGAVAVDARSIPTASVGPRTPYLADAAAANERAVQERAARSASIVNDAPASPAPASSPPSPASPALLGHDSFGRDDADAINAAAAHEEGASDPAVVSPEELAMLLNDDAGAFEDGSADAASLSGAPDAPPLTPSRPRPQPRGRSRS